MASPQRPRRSRRLESMLVTEVLLIITIIKMIIVIIQDANVDNHDNQCILLIIVDNRVDYHQKLQPQQRLYTRIAYHGDVTICFCNLLVKKILIYLKRL